MKIKYVRHVSKERSLSTSGAEKDMRKPVEAEARLKKRKKRQVEVWKQIPDGIAESQNPMNNHEVIAGKEAEDKKTR